MGRKSSHVIETKSRQLFAQMITEYSSDTVAQGDLLFREISERDYGIDGEVELFHQGTPTGRIAKIQIKGTDKTIIPLKRENCVSCKNITKSNVQYCQQRNYPVILVYCSNADKKFYYIDLQSVFHEKIDINSNKESWTVRIPSNCNSEDLSQFVDIINDYFDGFKELKRNNFGYICEEDSESIANDLISGMIKINNSEGFDTLGDSAEKAEENKHFSSLDKDEKSIIIEWVQELHKWSMTVSELLDKALHKDNPEERYELYNNSFTKYSNDFMKEYISRKSYMFALIEKLDEGCVINNDVHNTISNYIDEIHGIGRKYLNKPSTSDAIIEIHKIDKDTMNAFDVIVKRIMDAS